MAAYAVGLCGFLLAILAVLFLPTPLIRLGSRVGLAVTRPEEAALCAILALGLAVKLGGLLYPDTVVIDLTWHEKWQRTLLRGEFAALYFPSELSSGPGEWGAGVKIPKSPLYYVAMAPVALLPIATGAGLKLVAGLLDLALIPFAYAFLKRIDRGTAGVVAALLYTVTPLSYLILSYGSYPTLFAQFLSVLAFAVILLAGRRLDRPAVFGAFVALLTLSLLAYPVVAVFNVCLVSTFGLWRWRGAADRGDARRTVLLPGGAALAALLAFLAYYLQHVRVALASVGTLTGETARERAGADAGLLAAPGHIAAVALRNGAPGGPARPRGRGRDPAAAWRRGRRDAAHLAVPAALAADHAGVRGRGRLRGVAPQAALLHDAAGGDLRRDHRRLALAAGPGGAGHRGALLRGDRGPGLVALVPAHRLCWAAAELKILARDANAPAAGAARRPPRHVG